ncbi:hypothetical protein PT286_00285 [Neisseriaceae bacterium ESL0693]|nr:hypothetical protein [Neisseriaceae bacterium ESL0693]
MGLARQNNIAEITIITAIDLFKTTVIKISPIKVKIIDNKNKKQNNQHYGIAITLQGDLTDVV